MTTTVMIPALLAGLTVLAAAIVPLDAAGVPLGPLRIVAGTILTVWLPGMALIAAARPKSLARPVAFVMAIPLSLASFSDVDS